MGKTRSVFVVLFLSLYFHLSKMYFTYDMRNCRCWAHLFLCKITLGIIEIFEIKSIQIGGSIGCEVMFVLVNLRWISEWVCEGMIVEKFLIRQKLICLLLTSCCLLSSLSLLSLLHTHTHTHTNFLSQFCCP